MDWDCWISYGQYNQTSWNQVQNGFCASLIRYQTVYSVC